MLCSKSRSAHERWCPSGVVLWICLMMLLLLARGADASTRSRISSSSSSSSQFHRQVQRDDDDDDEPRVPTAPVDGPVCQICTFEGSTLRNESDVYPPALDVRFKGVREFFEDHNRTCAEWQTDFATFLPWNASACVALQNLLMGHCCDALPPFYKCQQRVKRAILLENDYDVDISPATGFESPVDITIIPHVNVLEVVNPGVNGGSVKIQGKLQLSWTDERLQWPAQTAGCTRIRLRASMVRDQSDIWVPIVQAKDQFFWDSYAQDASTSAIIVADGTVLWDLPFDRTSHCQTLRSQTRSCSFTLSRPGLTELDRQLITYGVKIPRDFGEEVSFPGYFINPLLSTIAVDPEDHELKATLYVEPLEENCLICGGIQGVSLLEDFVPTSQTIGEGYWRSVAPGQEGWNCRQLNDFLSEQPIDNPLCWFGRATFYGVCCQGITSRHECEESVRNQYAEGRRNGHVVAPDPTKGNLFNSFREEEEMTVAVSLDFEQLLGIDIKSNTMEVLVSLELIWVDDNLAWDPFIGGCYQTSFRASTDVEQTEIWVPEIDLLNQVEGSQTLPSSPASVYFTGSVWWRRTGVLKVACELTGIKMFPFDKPGCYMDFGSTRDPLLHRVEYKAGRLNFSPVEFSQRILDKSSRYQEYQVDTDNYEVMVESMMVSGYKNDVIRFQFYFERATGWYLLTFVYLYIVFTYLSFGMFFLDHQVGERLGYGASILFVMLAQDITMSQYTPIAQVRLWIDWTSMASKVWVILGLLESLFIIFASVIIPTLNKDDEENNNRGPSSFNSGPPARNHPLTLQLQRRQQFQDIAQSTRKFNPQLISFTDERLDMSSSAATDPHASFSLSNNNYRQNLSENTSPEIDLDNFSTSSNDDDNHDDSPPRRRNSNNSVVSSSSVEKEQNPGLVLHKKAKKKKIGRVTRDLRRSIVASVKTPELFKPETEETTRYSVLRKMDRFMFLIFFSSYTIYLTGMFLWAKNGDSY